MGVTLVLRETDLGGPTCPGVVMVMLLCGPGASLPALVVTVFGLGRGRAGLLVGWGLCCVGLPVGGGPASWEVMSLLGIGHVGHVSFGENSI